LIRESRVSARAGRNVQIVASAFSFHQSAFSANISADISTAPRSGACRTQRYLTAPRAHGGAHGGASPAPWWRPLQRRLP
jgi:hypothetical protein